MYRYLRICTGLLLVLVGMVGAVLPILPGWIVIGFGLVLLSADVPFLERFICRVEQRFPFSRKFLDPIYRWLARFRPPPPPCPPRGS